MGCQARDQRREVVAGEVPLEGLGDFVPVALEGVEGASEGGEVVEVVGLEQLALDDRVVDLDLVEPVGVYGQVNEERGWASAAAAARPISGRGARSR